MPEQRQQFTAPNPLRQKIGGSPPVADADLIAKAEAALQSLSDNFAAWLADELEKLDTARRSIGAEVSEADLQRVYTASHDLKGLGATCEFPLVTRLAASLCRLLDNPSQRRDTPIFLIDAHIDAIKAAVRDNVKTDAHPVGRVLAEELENRVQAFAA